MDIDKLQFSPAYKLVSDDLRQRIVNGSLAQEQALPTEADLSEGFGVHRSTVREALRQLEQEGLLRRDGKKLLVSMPQHSDLARVAERALRLRQVAIGDVWEVASALEPLCAALAARRITPEEIEALERCHARTQAIVAAGQSPVDIDIEFLDLVAAATHNQALLIARGPLSLLMRAGYAAIAPRLPQSGQRLLDTQGLVLTALRRGDGPEAEGVIRRHMADYRRGCEVAGMDLGQAIPPLP